jgi:hypothetical protein
MKSDPPKFYNPRAADLVACTIKSLRHECRHSSLAEIIEAKKHLELDPEKHASRLVIINRSIQRNAFLH